MVKTVTAFLEFCYIARRNIITDDSLEQLKIALHCFHESRQIFSGTVRAEGLLGFSLPRQHSMVHYYDNIKNFGSPNGLCSSITESKHITAVKRPWRRSNKHAALPQILKTNERLDKIAAARADFTARGMLVDSCLVQAIKEVFANLVCDEDPMDDSEDLTDYDETESEVSDDEFQTPPSDHSNTPFVHGLDDINTGIPNNAYEGIDEHTADDDHPPTLPGDEEDEDPQPLPTLPNDEEDNDCGPVEFGPLMNEVRFVGRKGQQLPAYMPCGLKHFLQHPRGSIPHHSTRSV